MYYIQTAANESQIVLLRCKQMCNAIIVRLRDELIEWLKITAAKAGVSQGSIIRNQLENARALEARPFLRLAGRVAGDPALSSRKGFSKRQVLFHLE